ncbi:WYL domain-containing protein [Pseudidiomarina sp. 1APP75-27a]|uniref:WYL domain-containing protein n=1 Tax=Pseudidiomarina terrestris TaxID=2820060 RepID=UPI002651B47D|nr:MULTISPECIES: WYL domain-containing protein [unclassified Pseudidiomarina]MDN7126057.1 WYL domain-containing protein [Pseudidiomarina sp. 1APR75-33.1]MEA3588023.1 WYL domain-containing protein [Pseudidiomarina sp. 1APP75-27a]
MQTVLRYLLMLRHIPRQPQKIDVNTLRERLIEQGIDVSIRTIQRNLIELSEVFPLTTDERGKPYGWSLLPDAPLLPLLAPTQVHRVASVGDKILAGVAQVELRCAPEIRKQLEAYPLNGTQQLNSDDERLLLTAKTELTDELIVWILSYGAKVEVLAPQELRDKVAEQAAAMHQYYQQQ